MRARILIWVCALWAGGCLYPEYGVTHDGGSAGAGGRGGANAGGRGGGAGGAGGSAAGRGGSAGGAVGIGGSVRGVGSAGSGGTTGAGGASAGRGGTTGAAGSAAGAGGGSGGRGGTTGGGGGAGSGGSAGTGGTTARGGSGGTAGSTAGTGGGVAGRGGSSGTGGSAGAVGAGGSAGAVGAGGSGIGGSTAAPSWVTSLPVVYQFDSLNQETLGVAASGDETLHLETDAGGSIVPYPDDTGSFIEGSSARLRTVGGPAYFRSRSGAALPAAFQTPSGTSFTLGGWFRVDSSLSGGPHDLITDDGPGAYQGGFNFQLDQRSGSFGTGAASAHCLIGVSATGYDWNEVQTGNDIGPDLRAGNRWVHLVCRYDAGAHTLTIFVGGAIDAQEPTTHDTRTGPGPFMLGCDQTFCQFLGNMDEVFFARSALSNTDVNRIYACGLDGSRCRCNGASYASCGFAQSCANNLPACNAATP